MKKRLFCSFIFLATFSLTCSALPERTSKLLSFAMNRTKEYVIYDGSYKKIRYPNGDVDLHLGVCSDLVIRSYRAIDVDLQKLVHEDMKKHFSLYPKDWGLSAPDSNIDHRRVPNLAKFFSRHGKVLSNETDKNLYKPGDIVTWNLRNEGSLPHIGIISDSRAKDGTPLVIHNIGRGPELGDMLFDFKVTGHYRYKLEG